MWLNGNTHSQAVPIPQDANPNRRRTVGGMTMTTKAETVRREHLADEGDFDLWRLPDGRVEVYDAFALRAITRNEDAARSWCRNEAAWEAARKAAG